MGNKIFKIALLLGALVAIAVGVGFFAPTGSPPALTPLPNPNGYDDFIAAGKMVSTNSSQFRTASQETLRELAATNAPALALGRIGLTRECRVPPSSITLNQEYWTLKSLSQAFAAEGKLAEFENHPEDAAKSYLDTIRLGYQCRRGGIVIDELVGIAVESIGWEQLQKVVPGLGAATSRELAKQLETLEAEGDTFADVLKQEDTWRRRNYRGLKYRLAMLVIKTPTAPIEKKFTAQQERIRRLTIQLAARAYQLEKGRAPASLADLVPDYLKAIPLDPVTGTNMTY